MKRALLLSALAFAAVALAQRVHVFDGARTKIHRITAAPIREDGGFTLTVHASSASADGGLAINTSWACETLTGPQRAALETLKQAAKACWNGHEGL